MVYFNIPPGQQIPRIGLATPTYRRMSPFFNTNQLVKRGTSGIQSQPGTQSMLANRGASYNNSNSKNFAT